MCVCVCVPKKSVGRRTPVGDVVEKNLQLVVIVKVCSDDSAHRRRHGELLRGDVLETMTRHRKSATHTCLYIYLCGDSCPFPARGTHV